VAIRREKMKAVSPVVSVIMPTYQRARYLPASVRSVVAQTHSKLELLVVDDGSTDATDEVLGEFDDARIRVIRLDHTGSPARARNVGLAAAKGAYVAFLDSDDVWLPSKLALQVEALNGRADCRWSYTGFDHIDEGGAPMPPLRGGVAVARSGWIVPEIVSEEALVLLPSVVAEASLLREVGRFDETRGLREDLDLCLRLAAHARACAIGEPLLRVRHHEGRTTFGVPEVRMWRVRTLQKLVARTTDRSIRRSCRRECGRELVDLARAYDWGGNSLAALGVLVRALRYPSSRVGWWSTLAKILIRPWTPEWVLERHRRGRRTAPARRTSNAGRDAPP
jgi:GT2 family glycosyltransferase